jgi:hypothetical protein
MTGHVATLGVPIDKWGRNVLTGDRFATCDHCGALTRPQHPRQARIVAAAHVAWSRDNPAAAADLAAQRAAMLAATGYTGTPGTDSWHVQMTVRIPPLYEPVPRHWRETYGEPAYATG